MTLQVVVWQLCLALKQIDTVKIKDKRTGISRSLFCLSYLQATSRYMTVCI